MVTGPSHGTEKPLEGLRASPSWAALPSQAKAWRLAHGTWAIAQLASLGYLWASAVTGRRDRWVWASVGFLLIEGGALIVGGGDCPVGPLQERWGDPTPFFELLLPPRVAKAAIPALAIVAVAGIAAIALIPRDRTRPRSSPG
jgi:hypothetical protein